MRVVQAYRFALDPTPAQERALRSHCGAQRFACNWGLGRIKANLAQREAERSYGIPEAQLTPAASWSAWALRKEFNAWRCCPPGRWSPTPGRWSERSASCGG
jgi:putative transposase